MANFFRWSGLWSWNKWKHLTNLSKFAQQEFAFGIPAWCNQNAGTGFPAARQEATSLRVVWLLWCDPSHQEHVLGRWTVFASAPRSNDGCQCTQTTHLKKKRIGNYFQYFQLHIQSTLIKVSKAVPRRIFHTLLRCSAGTGNRKQNCFNLITSRGLSLSKISSDFFSSTPRNPTFS